MRARAIVVIFLKVRGGRRGRDLILPHGVHKVISDTAVTPYDEEEKPGATDQYEASDLYL